MTSFVLAEDSFTRVAIALNLQKEALIKSNDQITVRRIGYITYSGMLKVLA